MAAARSIMSNIAQPASVRMHVYERGEHYIRQTDINCSSPGYLRSCYRLFVKSSFSSLTPRSLANHTLSKPRLLNQKWSFNYYSLLSWLQLPSALLLSSRFVATFRQSSPNVTMTLPTHGTMYVYLVFALNISNRDIGAIHLSSRGFRCIHQCRRTYYLL